MQEVHQEIELQEIPLNSVVRVRSRKYLVENSEPDTQHGTQLVTLRCLEDDAQGETLRVIWEREVDAKIITDEAWSRVASQGFDQGSLFQAYFNTLRWNFVTSTDASLFQAPYRAGIQIQDYQLEPLRRALEMAHVNLFIADDVGLGKTIEAGLILRELIIRQKVKRCVICAPPSVVHQWRDEMEQRFGISFEVYDRAYINEHRRQRGFGANPWMSHHFFIVSHAMIRRHEHFTLLKDWLGKSSPQSLLILDEAHHAAPASGSHYAIDSKLTQTMRALCARFTHRLFLSATPHNGHSNSFSTLLELLDPNTFNRGMEIKPSSLKKVMVRRLKKDLSVVNAQFPKRVVKEVIIDDLPEDTPELKWARDLQAYWKLRQARLIQQGANKRQTMAAKLPIILLQKRLLSSLSAFRDTLEVHFTALKSVYSCSKRVLEMSDDELFRLGDHEHSYSAEEDEDIDEVSDEVRAEDVKARLQRAEQGTVKEPELLKPELDFLKKLLAEVKALDLIQHKDPKLGEIIKWLQEHVCEQIKLGKKGGSRVTSAEWKKRRLIIFTEYADTKDYLMSALNYLIYGNTDGNAKLPDQSLARVASYSGGMDEEQRRLIKEAFNRPFEHEDSDLRILVATDAAREGINLQSMCYDLFHYDIPWNPGRLEQRNGRIDRKLQLAPEVYCSYFKLAQRVEDKVLSTLVEKSQTIEDELGSFNPVISEAVKLILKEGIDAEKLDQTLSHLNQLDPKTATSTPNAKSLSEKVKMSEEALEEHLTEEQISHYTVRIRAIKNELDAERTEALKKEVATLSELLDKARKWIDFDQGLLRDAMNAALSWSKLPALELVPGQKDLWTLPNWDEVLGRDPSWVHTLDALRESRKAGQKVEEWRNEAQLQPVVFEDNGIMRHGSVQLHLEHRVVRRLLQRFVAHGFTQDGLNRATALIGPSAVPTVILLGRLSLFGEGATRLHDQLIYVEARFPNEALEIQADDQQDLSSSLGDLKKALLEAREVSPQVLADLRARAESDLAILRPIIEKRAETAGYEAQQKLSKRGLDEGKSLEEQLQTLKSQLKAVEKELSKSASAVESEMEQIDGLFDSLGSLHQAHIEQEERRGRQLKVDLQAVQDRIKELTPAKIKAEVDQVKGAFEVKLTRVEPVGVVYLWSRSRG